MYFLPSDWRAHVLYHLPSHPLRRRSLHISRWNFITVNPILISTFPKLKELFGRSAWTGHPTHFPIFTIVSFFPKNTCTYSANAFITSWAFSLRYQQQQSITFVSGTLPITQCRSPLTPRTCEEIVQPASNRYQVITMNFSIPKNLSRQQLCFPRSGASFYLALAFCSRESAAITPLQNGYISSKYYRSLPQYVYHPTCSSYAATKKCIKRFHIHDFGKPRQDFYWTVVIFSKTLCRASRETQNCNSTLRTYLCVPDLEYGFS